MMKEQDMIAFVTCASHEEAKTIAERLVTERLAACVNIIPRIESCYRWEGAVTWDNEFLLMIKTTAETLPEVKEQVIKTHSYDLPELIAVAIDGGSDEYLQWIRDGVGKAN